MEGYVAFLDVLGFSALIEGADGKKRLGKYLGAVQTILNRLDSGPLKVVVSSDSLVVTTPDSKTESFEKIVAACAEMFGGFLHERIPIRGAIAHGAFERDESPKGSGVVVAGPAVIDAYRFERKQDWIGIMIAPSAVGTFAYLTKRCQIVDPLSEEGTPPWRNRVKEWLSVSGTVQPCSQIPFHQQGSSQPADFDGFALLPASLPLTPGGVVNSIADGRAALAQMRLLAPDPAAQAKYGRAAHWLADVEGKWQKVAAVMGAAK